MPVFTFSGKTSSGEKVQGERVAANKDGLASQLRKERITPRSIREKGKEFSLPTFGSSKVKVKEVAVFFRELPDGRFRVSLRSKGEVDVAAVAQSFGGGGHQCASGCSLDGPLSAATARVLAQLRLGPSVQ